MNDVTITAWIRIASVIFAGGRMAVDEFRSLWSAIHGPSLSEAEMTRILDLIVDDAIRRSAMAHAASEPTV